MGHFPVGDPQLVIAIAVGVPWTGITGGSVASPAFRAIGTVAADTLRIAPDDEG